MLCPWEFLFTLYVTTMLLNTVLQSWWKCCHKTQQHFLRDTLNALQNSLFEVISIGRTLLIPCFWHKPQRQQSSTARWGDSTGQVCQKHQMVFKIWKPLCQQSSTSIPTIIMWIDVGASAHTAHISMLVLRTVFAGRHFMFWGRKMARPVWLKMLFHLKIRQVFFVHSVL
jgi:hypothetical protein